MATCFNDRFHEACLRAKARIAVSGLGGIALVHGSYLQEYHALPEALSWRYRQEPAGPVRAAAEIGSRWLDLASFLTGLEIEAVSASFGAFAHGRANSLSIGVSG